MLTSPGRVVGIAALLGAVILAGCGSSGSSTSSKSTASATPAANANPVDRAFIAEIVPNDQLALAMARLATTHAQHPQIKVFASRVIPANTAQVAQLTGLAKTLGVTPKPMKPTVMTGMENDAGALGIQMYQLGMDQVNPTTLATAKPFDRTFLTMMASDLEGAMTMARSELAKGTNSQLRPVATTVLTNAGTGVTQLKHWQSMWYGKGAHGSGAMSGMKNMKGMKKTKNSGGGSGMKGMSHTGTTTTGTSTTSTPMSQKMRKSRSRAGA
jgi:uncharacterized protein (DUF305 family)